MRKLINKKCDVLFQGDNSEIINPSKIFSDMFEVYQRQLPDQSITLETDNLTSISKEMIPSVSKELLLNARSQQDLT